MIAVIAPMESETRALSERMSVKEIVSFGSIPAWIGTIDGHELALIRCGVGLVAAAAATAAAIERFRPRFVVNIGVAGGVGLPVMTPFVASRIVQADMDTTALGDEAGYLSDLHKTALTPDADLIAALCGATGGRAATGTLCSADRFVATEREKDALRAKFDAVCCDMEGAAVAHVCELFKTPYAVFRTISDGGDGEQFARFVQQAADFSAAVFCRFLQAYPDEASE